MPSIRIIKTPAGEAPLHIREAWVGLVLPLEEGEFAHRTRFPSFGVLSGPKTRLGALLKLYFGRVPQQSAYLVNSLAAMKVLRESDPAAARWWYENASHVIAPTRGFLFEVEACEEVPDEESPSAVEGEP